MKYRLLGRKTYVMFFLVLLFGTVVALVNAATSNEAFENENFFLYGGRKDGTFSVSYVGRALFVRWDRCDWNDQVFRININRSYPGSDWKFFSNSSRYQRTPSGRVPYGHLLDTPNAHVCIGTTEFDRGRYPNSFWTIADAQGNIYTWRR